MVSSITSYSTVETSPIEPASNTSIPIFNQIIFTPPLLSNGKTYNDPTSPSSISTIPSPPPFTPTFIESTNNFFSHTPPAFINSITTEFSALNFIKNLSSAKFVHSCSCLVSRKRNSSIFSSPLSTSPHLPPLTLSAMLASLNRYFILYHPTIPMLNPQVWKNKAFVAWNTIDQDSVLSFNQIELAIIYLLVALGSSNRETAFNYYEKALKIIPNVLDVPMCLNIIQYTLLLSVFEATVNKNLQESFKLAQSASKNSSALGFDSLLDVLKYGSLDIPGLNQTDSYRTWVCAYVWKLELDLVLPNTDKKKAKNVTTTIIDRAFTEIEFDSSILKLRVSTLETDATKGDAGLLSIMETGGLEGLQLSINYYTKIIGFPSSPNQFTQISQDSVISLAELILSYTCRQSPFAYLYKHILDRCVVILMYFYCTDGQSCSNFGRLKQLLSDSVAYLSICKHCGTQSDHTRIEIPAAGSISAVRFFCELETALQSNFFPGFAMLNNKDTTAASGSGGGSSSNISSPYESISPRSESPGTTQTSSRTSFMEPKIDIIENDKNSQVLKIVI